MKLRLTLLLLVLAFVALRGSSEKVPETPGERVAGEAAAPAAPNDLPTRLENARRKVEELPESAEAHFWFAKFLAESGETKQALQQLREAVRLDPGIQGQEVYRRTWNQRGAVTWVLVPKEQPERSERELEEARALEEEYTELKRRQVQRQPASAEAHLELARHLVLSGELGEGLKEAEEALRLDPASAEAKRLVEEAGKALSKSDALDRTLGSLEAGLGSYRELEELKPVEILVPPGKTKEEYNKELDAILQAEQAALKSKYGLLRKYLPSETERIRVGILKSYVWHKDDEGALRLYERLTKDYPSSPYVHSEYARALLQEKQPETAKSVLRTGQQRFPSDMALKVLGDGLFGESPPAGDLSSELESRLSALELN